MSNHTQRSTKPDLITNKMNVPDNRFSTLESLPMRHTKHQGVFGKYAASMAALEDSWTTDGHIPRGVSPMTPMTPSMPLSYGQDSFDPSLHLDPIKSEETDQFFSPASLESTVSPDDLLAVDNSPLLDTVDGADDMQNWESLFLEAGQEPVLATQGPEQPQGPDQSQLQPTQSSPQPEQQLQQTSSPSMDNGSYDADRPLMDDKAALDFELADLISEQANGSASPQMMTPRMGTSPMIGGVSKAKSLSAAERAAKKKVDDLGITVYKRKPRSTPLMPVEVPEDGDSTAAKRAKNTEAARRSRARKLERMSQLEERVRELISENDQLRAELKQIKGE